MRTNTAALDETVVAVIAAFVRDAEYMAELTATFLDHIGPILKPDQSSWDPAFLLELSATLRIRQWEVAGIKDAIDPTLPTFDEAFVDLAQRLQAEPGRFLRGETPLLPRVVKAWWRRCAHPNERFLGIDVVFFGVERQRLISHVAQLLWRIRDL